MAQQFSGEFSPRCPNHRVVLIKTDMPGIGICPISSARFEYDAEEAEKTKKLKIDAMGKPFYEADWNLKSIDGNAKP